VVPKSGETADRIVRRATTDVLLKMGLYGVKVSIAIKNSIAPDVELIEPTSPSPEENAEKTPDEAQTQQAPQTAQEQVHLKEAQAPRSSRRSSMSKKESKKEVEATQN
jgi:ribosomal protein S3